MTALHSIQIGLTDHQKAAMALRVTNEGRYVVTEVEDSLYWHAPDQEPNIDPYHILDIAYFVREYDRYHARGEL